MDRLAFSISPLALRLRERDSVSPLLQRHVRVRAVRLLSLPFLLHRSATDAPGPVGWTPLLGFIKDPPLRRFSTACPLPVCPKTHFRPEVPTSDMFRSCRFSRLQRFAPRGVLQVCCTLLPAMGFAVFPARSRIRRFGWGLSRRRSTLRSFPLLDCLMSRHLSCLRRDRCVHHYTIPSRRCLQVVRLVGPVLPRFLPEGHPVTRPQGVEPPKSPLQDVGVATDALPDASMGFVPTCPGLMPCPTPKGQPLHPKVFWPQHRGDPKASASLLAGTFHTRRCVQFPGAAACPRASANSWSLLPPPEDGCQGP
jgi:hypothetical protein